MTKTARVQALTPFKQICSCISKCAKMFFDSGWDRSSVSPSILEAMDKSNEIGNIHLFEGLDKSLLILLANASHLAAQNVECLQKLCTSQDKFLVPLGEFVVNGTPKQLVGK